MNNSMFRKKILAAVVAGTFVTAAMPAAEAEVLNVSWRGAFTMQSPTGSRLFNDQSDYRNGYYANGDGAPTYGAPWYPGNVGPNAVCKPIYNDLCYTSHGWHGARTPVSGTMSFDLTNGAGVGTINPFFWMGDTPGSGAGSSVAHYMDLTFQSVDTMGTIVGTMLFSWYAPPYDWYGGVHSVSIVLDGSGLFSQLGTASNPGPAMIDFMTNGPTTTISGVGALPATDGLNYGSTTTLIYYPLGNTPIATKTLNALGCEGLPVASQVNVYTITTNFTNLSVCDLSVDDGIGGSPMASPAFGDHNVNFDILSVHLISIETAPVPIPAAMWLFGSGLLGLIGLARRKAI